MNTPKKIYASVFLAGTFIMFCAVMLSELRGEYHIWKDGHSDTGWDAAKEFGEKPELNDTGSIEINENGFTARIALKQEEIEDFASRRLNGNIPFVLLQKGFDRYVWGYDAATSHTGTARTNTGERNVIIQSTPDTLNFLVTDENVVDNTQSLISFCKRTEEQGCQFLFMELPVKSPSQKTLAERYDGVYSDFQQKTHHCIDSMLQSENVPYIDLTSCGLKFFATDHHWLPQSALKADSILAHELNTRYGYDIDESMYSLSNYDIKESEAMMLGSQGKKVTEVYTNLERLPLVLPKYETDLTVFRSNTNDTIRGDIQTTLLDESAIDPSSSLYTVDRWGYYGYNNNAFISIHNNRFSHPGRRVLLVKESFSNAMYPYLCHTAEWVYVVHLAYFNGSLQRLIEKCQPQTIVVAYSSRSFQDSENFDSSKTFDFR